MALLTNAPRGTQDVLPSESAKWQYIEQRTMEVARRFGFREIRFPTFEHTELFCRSVGDATDVVQKEMYTFADKSNRSITLRPEGTAGTMRAILQHGLLGGTLPLKLSYLTSCFRYEKPQAGRLREFHQFGIELVGAASPETDAQVIAVGDEIFKDLGITGLRLEINSIGCPNCRPAYHKALKEYFEASREQLCDTCQGRLETNPMRILDCKSPICAEIASGAPKGLDYLCDECKEHFEQVQQNLDALGLEFTVNPRIVRGLDYYTRTVFEFIATGIGAQGTICGGGRYDGLIEILGAAPTPSVGYAMGLERILLVMEQQGCYLPGTPLCEMYIGNIGAQAGRRASVLAKALRADGHYVEYDLMGRSVKAQMKYADKLGARYSCIIGENELAAGKVQVKPMDGAEAFELALTCEAFEGLFTAAK